jgi:hypothetical protein
LALASAFLLIAGLSMAKNKWHRRSKSSGGRSGPFRDAGRASATRGDDGWSDASLSRSTSPLTPLTDFFDSASGGGGKSRTTISLPRGVPLSLSAFSAQPSPPPSAVAPRVVSRSPSPFAPLQPEEQSLNAHSHGFGYGSVGT